MKKSVFLVMSVLALGLASCRGYEREQDRLDRESEGKGELLKAESTKKVQIEQAKADLESAKLNAQTKLEKVKAEAESRLISSKAYAEATVISAKGEAEANRLLTQSLSPMILEYMKINRWNGKLSTTSLGGGTGAIINIK